MPFRHLLLFLLLLPASLAGVVRAEAAENADPRSLCAGLIAEAERLLGVPTHLLAAIATVESGRWDRERRENLAWPWTVMAEGRGRFLPSREAAVREVEALRARGVRNIDVGCMQINLMYHGAAFDSLEQAFDPAYNVAYGATFLTDLRRELNSWTRAVGRYHSATPVNANRYRAKVMAAWRERKRQAQQVRRAARLRQVAESELLDRLPGPLAAN